ncbi:MAG: GAF domain-containing protein [Firmicutes bacterium]|uniref:GAF domain-containing protein n=1 Tax=Melghirimyces thermohalophilus TaxID=1236220 RepID=A0A1G6R099_9BACL|nr:GAF domain-containing protein [Melghirimyces thermohalophilus]MDA8352153.1 GAF domain-containing protein [Bacillota bacterium]SDC98032.1 GAF domain-containing protein [Melghirimyces thermohalophilus]
MFERKQVEGSKDQRYESLLNQAHSLLEDERDWVANLANAASLLYHSLETVNWAGFYLMRGEKELILGPFMGQPACIRIPVGQGVCGTAVKERETQLVPDVHQFPGHIACDAASRSEIVVPLENGGKVVGVLDIDSPKPGRFDETDRKYLQSFARIVQESIDWNNMKK